MANNHSAAEKRLWEAADQFRANSDLKSSEYAVPVLGLIFLRYADHRFTQAEQELVGKGSGRRKIGKEDYQAKGVMYLPPKARFSYLLALPEGENIGKAINEAMKAVEAENVDLKGVLPRTYTKIDNLILASLLKNFSQIAVDAQGDKFGKIYEYFLGNFARAEGHRVSSEDAHEKESQPPYHPRPAAPQTDLWRTGRGRHRHRHRASRRGVGRGHRMISEVVHANRPSKTDCIPKWLLRVSPEQRVGLDAN